MRPRIRPGDRLWTYQQIAALVGCCVDTVRNRACRMRIPIYRKPQDNQRYLYQADVERMLAAWLITVRHKGEHGHAETAQETA